jgi:hypothetical protein
MGSLNMILLLRHAYLSVSPRVTTSELMNVFSCNSI